MRREGSFAKPIAAVVLAWESQSTRSVGWWAAARHAERLTAVVVFPTPPFWLAIAMIRATDPRQRKSSKGPDRLQVVSRGTKGRVDGSPEEQFVSKLEPLKWRVLTFRDVTSPTPWARLGTAIFAIEQDPSNRTTVPREAFDGRLARTKSRRHQTDDLI